MFKISVTPMVVRVRLVNEKIERLREFAIAPQRVVHFQVLFVKAPQEEMRQLSGVKQALQARIHIARVARVFEPAILGHPRRQHALLGRKDSQGRVCTF
jgi:hypothetical protein